MAKPTTTNEGVKVATKGTPHVARATSPDVCYVKRKPQAFDNYVESKKLAKGATTTVTIADDPVWTSVGELGPPSEPAHAGTDKGIHSGTYRGEAKPTSYSSTLFFEGNAAVRTGDTTTQNHANTVGQVVEGTGGGDLTSDTGFAGDKGIVAHPVDAITGRSYTQPVVDLMLPGPLAFVFERRYSSRIAHRDIGLGYGWTHSLGWELELALPGPRIFTDEGIALELEAMPAPGRHVRTPWGWELRAHRGGFELDTKDGFLRVFGAQGSQLARHRLTEIRDVHDNRIVLTRDAARLSSIRDSAGRSIVVASDELGRISALTVVDPDTHARVVVARYAYDDRGDLTTASDALGYARRYAYDHRHLLVAETDRAALTFHFVYDVQGRCVETWGEYADGDPSLADDLPATLADGRTPARGVLHTCIEYHANGAADVVDSTRVQRFRGNRHGLVESSSNAGGTVRRRYDDQGRIVARTDEIGATTRFERDQAGRIVAVTDALGRSARVELDRHDLPVTLVDPTGGKTVIARDPVGRIRAVTDPTGATASYAYDPRGMLAEAIDRIGERRSIRYDERGQPIAVEQASGGVWRWSYDGLGRVVRETDPLGHATERRYSERGDMLEVRDPSGAVTRYEYDGEGRPVRVHYPNGGIGELVWGGYHSLCEVRDATGRCTRLRYNRDGELVQSIDPGGEVFRFRYDDAGRLVELIGFDGGREKIRYDAAGRVRVIEPAGAGQVELRHDAAGQPIERRLPDGALERYAWDARGAVVGAHTAAGQFILERDALGRVVRDVQIVEGEEHWVESVYDPAGNRIEKKSSLGHHERIRHERADRHVVVLDGEHIEQTFDLLGREALRKLPDGACIHTEFDARGRVARRRVLTGAAVQRGEPAWLGQPAGMFERAYRYDEMGELVEVHDERGLRRRYGYDPHGRITSLEQPGETIEAFGYDPAGRALRAHQAREWGRGGRLLRDGATHYRWNDDGCLVEKRIERDDGALVWTFAWDGADQLASVTTPTGSLVEFLYDPFARRVLKRVRSRDGRVTTTRYVWDGDQLLHEIRRDDGGAAWWRTYWFLGRSPLPGAHRDMHGGWQHYLNDPAGAPEALIAADGTVACELSWSASGRVQPASATPLRYLGQYADDETGLVYNRCRYFDPDAMRFLSTDPIGLLGSTDLYAPPRNPTGYSDPLGLQIIITVDPRLTGYQPPPPPPPTVARGPGFLLPVFSNKGWFTVNAHSNPEGVVIPPMYDTFGANDGYTQNASDIAKWLRAQPGYKPGMKVLLVSCNAGDNTNGIAQRLADELNAPVKAATGYVSGGGPFWMLMNSNHTGLARLTNWPDGVWRTFYPGKPGKFTVDD